MEDLVVKAKAGNKEAYSELVKLIYNDLLRITLKYVKNEDEAKDVLQDTLLNAYLSIDSLRINSNFKNWITKILINNCKTLYGKSKKNTVLLEKYSSIIEPAAYMEDNFDFDNFLKGLNDKEKEIFHLYFEDDLSIKQISKKLSINENTIKTHLHRGKFKLRKRLKPATIFVLVLCLFIATSVAAVSIISYIKSLFDLKSIGKNNIGVLNAIETLDWFQETNMDYIDLGDGYNIKLDYIVLDEMCLYMVFDFNSEKDISNFKDISITDLKITNENGDVICDVYNNTFNQHSINIGDKIIEKSHHNMKFLIFAYTYSFPESSTLNINFSNVVLSKDIDNTLLINYNVDFQTNLSEKFINREYVSYECDDTVIEKAIISETGFYAIISINKNIVPNKITLVDENNISHECSLYSAAKEGANSDIYNYFVVSDFYDKESSNLKFIIDDTEYELNKKN